MTLDLAAVVFTALRTRVIATPPERYPHIAFVFRVEDGGFDVVDVTNAPELPNDCVWLCMCPGEAARPLELAHLFDERAYTTPREEPS